MDNSSESFNKFWTENCPELGEWDASIEFAAAMMADQIRKEEDQIILDDICQTVEGDS